MRRFYFIWFLFTFNSVFAGKIDSLKTTLFKTQADTSRASIYLEIADLYYETEGSLDSTEVYFSRALAIYERHNLYSGICEALNGRGLAYREKGLYNLSLQDYLRALSLAEKHKSLPNITRACNGIAIVHAIQEDFEKAYYYYDKARVIHQENNNTRGLASIYNNLGLLFYAQKQFDSTVFYYNKALKYNHLNDNTRGVATVNENLGLLYLEHQNNPQKALENFAHSLTLWREMGDLNSVSITLDYTCMALLKMGRYKECIDTAKSSLKMANEVGNLLQQRNAFLRLHEAYEKLNNEKLSLRYFKEYIHLRDSLNNQNQLREFTALQLNYEFDKKRSVDSLQQELKNAEFTKKIEQHKSVIYIVLVGLGLSIILVVVAWVAYKSNKKAKNKIYDQKELLEVKNRGILDSINYAKRIQEAILPPQESVEKLLPYHFILYKPKDIVSGDFYWIEGRKNKVYFGVVDCTGHGVPGAFMSILGRNGLQDALSNLSAPSAAEILEYLNRYVNLSLHQSFEDNSIRDGMDIALCVLDTETLSLQFAGANNPLWVIKADCENTPNKSAIKIKGDKQPIGKFEEEYLSEFTNHNLQLVRGDQLYLFSDGIADQFGGARGKKFMHKQLEELLLTVQNKSMNEQKEAINKAFENWKGDLEQVDDVCVIGVRL